ncbi:MAG: cytochrome c biogenesis CcdA family protein [Actinobacteria bacterium]|nr:cytochrome c biogenesis CcdA family protein [Actinomycetota bacterium]
MLEASYLAAFFGGVLTLLSPCSALLLPAFFAYAFGGAGELVKKTGFFYLGLATTLVPLGMGISAVSRLVYGQRGTLILVSGLVIILLGVLQLAGRGFSVGPLARLRGRIRGDSAGGVFALGAVYGFAGFCSGPILGTVLTVAASSGHVAQGAGLLAVYALGMAAPLFLLAAFWDRLKLGRRWLRGRELSLGPLRIHTTNLVSGLMFVVLGTVFILYEGTSALSSLYEENGAVDLAYASETWVGSLSRAVPDYLLLVVLAVALALARVGAYLRKRNGVSERRSRDGEEASR